MSSRPLHFEPIDILRGFAALSVVVYHIIEHFNWTLFPTSGPLVWFRAGWMGVDLFFVISGLVIGLSAFSGIDRNGPSEFRKQFATRRIARIVPLHYLTLLVFIVLVSPELFFNGFVKNLLAHIFFVHNLTLDWHGAINGSNWSLGTEMQFYALMLLIAPWVKTNRWWIVGAVLVGISWFWRFGVALFVHVSPDLGPFPVFVASTQLPGTLDEFAFGLILARLVRSELFKHLLTSRGRLALFLTTTLLMSACLWLYWHFASSYWGSKLMMVVWRSFLGLSLASVLLFSLTWNISGIARTLLSPLYYLGTISYGIYLWHLPVLMSLKRLPWLSPIDVLYIAIPTTCILASVSWHFFEAPIMSRLTNEAPIKNSIMQLLATRTRNAA